MNLSVIDLKHAHAVLTAVIEENIQCIEQLILYNFSIIVKALASEVKISVGNIETIIQITYNSVRLAHGVY